MGIKPGTIAVALMLALGACTGLDAGVGTAIEKGRATADTVMKGNLALVCAGTLGSYFRLENARQQQGLVMICAPGGEPLPE